MEENPSSTLDSPPTKKMFLNSGVKKLLIVAIVEGIPETNGKCWIKFLFVIIELYKSYKRHVLVKGVFV